MRDATPPRWPRSAGGSGASDTNYIFLTFVTQHLPAGLVGLVLAVIFGATMSAISAEMSALATVTRRRHLQAPRAEPTRRTTTTCASRVSRRSSGACTRVICAHYVKGLGSLVEVVNVLGSLFYGGMLGVFVLAFFFKRVHARGAFYGVLVGEAVIFACWYYTSIAFLWYNVIGCVVVILTGLALSLVDRRPVRVSRKGQD